MPTEDSEMLKRTIYFGILSAFCLAVSGCASPGPAVPSMAVIPGKGKTDASFQKDDEYCQASAQQAIGYQSPGEAANQAAIGSAAVGTVLGGLAGAAIGSASGNAGAGAAIGAGTGLVAGSAVGAGNASAAGGSLQARYDSVYAQCMTAKGNRVAPPPQPVAVYGPPPPPVYVYPRPYYWGPRPYYWGGYGYYRYGW